MTDHNKFKIFSDEMKNYMKERLIELSDFHIYCNNNDITYSIRSGTALGYFTIGKYLPWDDDIDISYKNTDYNKILKLYNSGDKLNNQWKDNNWEFRNIILNNNKYYIAKLVGKRLINNFTPYSLFKLIKNNNKILKNQKDLGGLDIFPQINYKNVKFTHELKFLSKPILINFSNIETYLLFDKQHIESLIKAYGKPTTWGNKEKYFTKNELELKHINIKKLIKKF